MSEELNFKSATELIEGIKIKDFSIKEVMQAHIKQINKMNPKINAIVSLEEDKALKKAIEMDNNIKNRPSKQSLLGIPIAIKDTHNAKGFMTTYGSEIYRDNRSEESEIAVERMVDEGAIILGKTNVPEFAAGSHSFNKVFGTTYNPYDTSKTAGGSSGGAAASLASGMVALADGSDMGGSCRNPAAYNNIVGLRPSPGLIPVKNKRASFSPLSVQGPLARTVEDVALMLSVMAGYDKRAPLSNALKVKQSFDLTKSLPLKDIKIGYSADLGGMVPIEQKVRTIFNQQISKFEDLGCFVEEASINLTGAAETFQILRAHEFSIGYEDIYLSHQSKIKETVLWNIEKGLNLTSKDIRNAEIQRTNIYNEANNFFKDYDFMISPVSQVQPFDAKIEYPTEIDGIKMETYVDWMESCSIITVTGCPAISVPAGFTEDGLPFGLQIIAPLNQEEALLNIAYAFEQATKYGLVRPK